MSQDVHIDQETLRELRGVLGDDFTILVNTYLADSTTRLAALRAALGSGDTTLLREAAHSLKGSSLNIGATQLAGLCLAIEQAARSGSLHGIAVQVDDLAAELRVVSDLLLAVR